MKVVRPGGLMLAFFSSNEKMTSLPLYNYRIQDPKTLLLVPRNTSGRSSILITERSNACFNRRNR